MRGPWAVALAVGLAGCTGAISDPPAGPYGTAPDALRPGPTGIRTLTPAQYRESVRDVLGADVPVEPVGQWRSSIAAARGGIAPATVTAYEEAAFAAAAFMFADPARRDALLRCAPEAAGCAEAALARIGRRAFRRPLTDDERARYLRLAADVGAMLGDPARGLEHAIAGLLQSPHFLYRVELGEPDPDGSRLLRYTSHEMATRVSYLVWGTTPDDELLDAADAGALLEADGVRAQVQRLLRDERARTGVRDLFRDLFGADEVLTTEKDLTRYPFFTDSLRTAIRDQLVRTAEEAVRGGDYRDLFTTRRIYMNAELAALWGIEGDFDETLVPFDLPDGDPRGGILTLAGFVAQHAYPAKTSPALRGLFVRKVLLCQDIPPPPSDVMTVLPEPAEGELVTTRQLLQERHEREPRCASCHGFMDPIGLALEQLDAVGQFRATQNGLTIDPSGELDGVPFEDAPGLGRALADHPRLAACFIQNLHGYASGRSVLDGERVALDAVTEAFVRSGYRLDDAIVALAESDAFRFGTEPTGTPAEEP